MPLVQLRQEFDASALLLSDTFEARPGGQFRATRLEQPSTGKDVAKRLPNVVVKWSPNVVLHRAQKKKGLEKKNHQ